MNKKVDEEFIGIKDVYVLQCMCTELKELCDKYEEEHNTTFKEWQKDIQANKKAVEYIKENQEEEYVTGRPMLSYWAIDNLLSILGGK